MQLTIAQAAIIQFLRANSWMYSYGQYPNLAAFDWAEVKALVRADIIWITLRSDVYGQRIVDAGLW